MTAILFCHAPVSKYSCQSRTLCECGLCLLCLSKWKGKSLNLVSMEVFCFPSFGEENEGRREGEVCGSSRFLWGPHLAPLFLRKWAWWTLGSGSRGVSGAVSPQWIPLWFLTPLSRLHYSSREEEAGQLSQTPFGRIPQAPDKWLCATGAGKKSNGWGGSDHGSQGGQEGFRLGLYRHRDYMRPGHEGF